MGHVLALALPVLGAGSLLREAIRGTYNVRPALLVERWWGSVGELRGRGLSRRGVGNANFERSVLGCVDTEKKVGG